MVHFYQKPKAGVDFRRLPSRTFLQSRQGKFHDLRPKSTSTLLPQLKIIRIIIIS